MGVSFRATSDQPHGDVPVRRGTRRLGGVVAVAHSAPSLQSVFLLGAGAIKVAWRVVARAAIPVINGEMLM